MTTDRLYVSHLLALRSLTYSLVKVTILVLLKHDAEMTEDIIPLNEWLAPCARSSQDPASYCRVNLQTGGLMNCYRRLNIQPSPRSSSPELSPYSSPTSTCRWSQLAVQPEDVQHGSGQGSSSPGTASFEAELLLTPTTGPSLDGIEPVDDAAVPRVFSVLPVEQAAEVSRSSLPGSGQRCNSGSPICRISGNRQADTLIGTSSCILALSPSPCIDHKAIFGVGPTSAFQSVAPPLLQY